MHICERRISCTHNEKNIVQGSCSFELALVQANNSIISMYGRDYATNKLLTKHIFVVIFL